MVKVRRKPNALFRLGAGMPRIRAGAPRSPARAPLTVRLRDTDQGAPERRYSRGWNLPLPTLRLYDRSKLAMPSGWPHATRRRWVARSASPGSPRPGVPWNSYSDTSSSSPRLIPEILLELGTRTVQDNRDNCRRCIHHPGDLAVAVVLNE